MDIVNDAYEVETGDKGVAFKSARRFRNIGEAQEMLEYLYVLRVEGEIVGVVNAKLRENSSIVEIGPVAVHPRHQVRHGDMIDFVLLSTIYIAGKKVWIQNFGLCRVHG